MRTLVAVLLSATALASACSGASSTPSKSDTQSAASAQSYFTALDAAFRETINPAAVDPSSPNSAAPIRNALQRLRAIQPPASLKDLHERLIKAGQAYADAIDAIQTQMPSNPVSNDATELPVGLQRALVDAQRTEADLAGLCIDLEQAAKASNATFTACTGGSNEPGSACIEFGEPLTSATPGPLQDAQTTANRIAGRSLPLPKDLPVWVTRARAGRAVLNIRTPKSGSAMTALPSATAVPTQVLGEGAAIVFVGDDNSHPQVTITFGPPEPCAEYAYAQQSITGGSTTATVQFVTSSGSRSDLQNAQINFVALAASFTSHSIGVVVNLEWEQANAPSRTEQVAEATDWVKRVLAAE